MNRSLESKINQYLVKHPDILEDELRLKSVLQDFYEQDYAQVNRLMKAYHEQIVYEMLTTARTEFSVKNEIAKLIQNQDMIKEKAELVVNCWKKIINTALVKSYANYQQEKELCETLKETIEKADSTELEQLIKNRCGLHEYTYEYLSPFITQRRKELEQAKVLERHNRLERSITAKNRLGSRIYANREIHEMLEQGIKKPFLEYVERAPLEMVHKYREQVKMKADKDRLDKIIRNEDTFDFADYVSTQEVTK